MVTVTAQNVQISSNNSVTNSAAAANQSAAKVETSSEGVAVVAVSPTKADGSSTNSSSSSNTNSDTVKFNDNGRPSNKRASLDNALFSSIARRRISPFPDHEANSVIHSQSLPLDDHNMTMMTEHVLCSPSRHSLSDSFNGFGFSEDHTTWLFNSSMGYSPFQLKDASPFSSAIQRSFDFNNGASIIHQRNDQVLKTIQSIIDLNDNAIDCYRIGEYDASLEALRDAESRRVALETSTKTACGSAVSCASSDKKCSDSGSNSDGNTKAVTPSSYIYQRMDFDEGMHSYANLEKINGSDLIEFVSMEESFSGYASLRVKSQLIQAMLMFNIGQVHRRRGEFDVAAINYESAFEVLKTAGTNDSAQQKLLIPILHNIGQLQYRCGELTTAIETYELALTHAKSMEDGTAHVASALNCLGVLHYHANSSENEDDNDDSDKDTMEDSSTAEAMELFQQALTLRKQCLGPDHVDVATTLNNIGRIYVQADQFDQALGYYQDALRIRRISLGTNSLDYAATAFNAGQSLHQKGELEEAKQLYHEFLRVASIKFGNSHRDVAVVLSGIAQIYQEQKNYDKALELYEESLLAGKAALGEYHSEIAMLLNRMGNFHFERERLGDALKCYKRGLRIEKRVLPPDHPNIVVTYSNLGEIHRQRGEWSEAAKMYSEALEILKKKHAGEDNSDVASTLNTLGLIHDQRGDSHLSLSCLQNALQLRRRIANNNAGDCQASLDVAATLVYIGTILYRKSSFPEALELFNESLQIRQKILGKDHRDTAFVMYNMALVHQQRGDYEQSVEFFSETLRIEKIALGERHKDVCMTLFKLGEVHKAAENLVEALQCFQQSLEIERGLSNNPTQTVGRRHISNRPDPAAMARTLAEIGNIHLVNGDVVPMMDAFNEASRLYRSAGLSPHNIVVSGRHAYAIEFSFPEAAPAA